MIREKSIVVGRNMIEEIDYEKNYVYKFGDMWFDEKQLVSLTNRMKVWTNVKTNTTKYRILQNELRWLEVPFDFFGDVAAPLFDNYRITTNGRILDNKNKEMSVRNLSVKLTTDGVRRDYYVADLMWHAFVDNRYNPELRMIYFANSSADFQRKQRDNDIGLDELMIKDKLQDKYDAAVADKADPSPQPITTAPEEPQALEVLFGTTPDISIPTPQYNERYEESTNLIGSAPQTKIITVSGRQKRRFN